MSERKLRRQRVILLQELIGRQQREVVVVDHQIADDAEWADREPEVVPLGLTKSPYPDRIVAKPGFEKELAKRTLTNLYNQRPAWLTQAHETLDAAVAVAYGWTDYTTATSDDEFHLKIQSLPI